MKNVQDIFVWANEDYLYALGLIPIMIIFFIFATILKNKALKRFGEYRLVKELMPLASKSRPVIKFSGMIISLTLIIFAIARPQFGIKTKEITKKGAEVIIALDVSKSMLAEDITPNRLAKAKKAIQNILEKADGSKFGLIVFAGEAYTQIPITADYSAAELFLASVTTDIVPVPGTNISSAIEHAFTSFSPLNKKGKALIIITDGEDHDDKAIEKAIEAKEKGITVFTIGMGLPAGAPIPTGKKNEYKKDADGNTVISRLNEDFLNQLAKSGGGIYTRANNFQTGLSYIYEELSKMESDETKAEVAQYDERYDILIAIALFFLVIEFFILERKNKWLSKLNILG